MITGRITPLLLCSAALSLPALRSAAADTGAEAESDFPPKVRPLSAFDHLNRKSPFEFDARPAPSEPAADPFAGVSLAGYCGSGGTLTVYLLAGEKERKRIAVYGDDSALKPGDDSGFRVVGINRGRSLKDTSVRLEKDGVTRDVTFLEDTLRPGKTVAGSQPAPRPNPGPMPPGTGSGASKTGTPPPVKKWQHTEPVIPGIASNKAAGSGTPEPVPATGQAAPALTPAPPVPVPGRTRRVVIPAVK